MSIIIQIFIQSKTHLFKYEVDMNMIFFTNHNLFVNLILLKLNANIDILLTQFKLEKY